MKKKNPLILGTFILTITGFISRFIGFFYRIFLSRVFGAEGMGLYQLISPVLALTFSVTVSGMQTAISKFVASETSTRDYKSSFRILLVGFFIAMALSFGCMAYIYTFSEMIAEKLLFEPRTAPLLRIISLSIPMATVHSCINGYFYGIRKTFVPAMTQLVEQVVRVGSIFLLYEIFKSHGQTPTISFAVAGLVIGESASMIVSLVAIYHRFYALTNTYGILSKVRQSFYVYFNDTRRLLSLAIPLSLNRTIINFLQSVEAIYIPQRLQLYGYDNAKALSVYGVLMGMSLPLILFPSAITNSISVLLLPLVSEADAVNNQKAIKKAVRTSIKYCFLLGFLCTGIFLASGRFMGMLLYESHLAGTFILVLSFICPFMYVASTLNSILNGLGKTGLTFTYSMLSLIFRLFFVFFSIPVFGIQGYLIGLLASQLLQTSLCVFAVRKYLRD
ncbi:putative polysaccharide biosynthesis protein [Kineothrix sp. MB12-C1]|uniref:putative polysaccharide biosynthesis protein n=1 Tax=Kineothrix sp. MB12-C1 TaxID=3070215 RepID=UPI0027D3297D|nr:polysaccharide biosynthesis protein [Kineothrix sp. MB12-C1]WMC92903.1 polysaccharide biosynthesis protein [Kineothrix sp. MB12-C1]